MFSLPHLTSPQCKLVVEHAVSHPFCSGNKCEMSAGCGEGAPRRLNTVNKECHLYLDGISLLSVVSLSLFLQTVQNIEDPSNMCSLVVSVSMSL